MFHNVPFRKRTLKLELTDGNENVIAMEHCPIPCLNTKILPGAKILIKGESFAAWRRKIFLRKFLARPGPMRCVNKVLFLQPRNVKVLGGEVERLSIENAYENVLLKALGRPITSTPKLDYKGQYCDEELILSQLCEFILQKLMLSNKTDRCRLQPQL